MSTFKIVASFLLINCALLSQNEFNYWYFGSGAGLCFSVSPPASDNSNSSILYTAEGSATMSDANGNLLFYTNGLSIGTKNHTVMANGGGLNGNQSSTQAAIIVKQPGNTNIYYVFTTFPQACYNIVDMNLAAGYGSVTLKNGLLFNFASEKQVAVRHCNGKDIWIINHEQTNNFRSYLLTASGLNTTAVISSIGDAIGGINSLGQLKVSPNGKKLAMACNGPPTPTSTLNSGFQLFDFDAATGVVSNSLVISRVLGAYGVEFSPDGKLLYGGISSAGTQTNAALYQWDICQTNTAAILASQYSVSFNSPLGTSSIQWAVDGKLYVAPNDPSNRATLHVINNPNVAGIGMGLSLNSISTGTKSVNLGLPNFINNYTRPTPTPYTTTLSCQTASFAVPPIPTFSSGCSTTPYAPSGYLWDFGEPSSGSANSSTITNPSHYYANTGTYTVSLILFNNCTNDTLKQVVNVTTAGPKPEVAGTFTICKGDRFTYTVSGGTSYLWHNNATTPTISLAPTTTTVYSVRTTSNGCSLNKSFTVNVNPCTGLSNVSSSEVENQIKFFPNPVNNLLNVSSKIEGKLNIIDMSGRIVLESNIEAGENNIQTEGLKAGVYVMEVTMSLRAESRSDSTVFRSRLVKLE